ncbi:MAG: hypothetical protein KI790_21275, partial [Cyclobacteriaceae bacterium]|nr:hypothetical protein [Cyclobacteriaceae bacterium HetDA_MAG_MS6]
MPKINRRNFIQYTSLASSSLLVPSAWASEKPGIAENGGRADADFEQLTYPSYNLNTIGFTKANSWLMLIKRENQLLFKTIDHDVISEKWMPYWAGDMFRITFYEDGKPVDFEFDTSPWQLDVKVGSNKVSFTFADDQTILMQGAGVDFKCEMQQAIAWQYDLPQRKTVMVAQAKRSIEMKFEKNKIVAAGQRPKTELEDFKLASPGEEVKMAFRIVKVDGHWDEPLPSF